MSAGWVPAGVGVYDDRLLSEATNGRPAFVFSTDGRHADVARHTWTGSVRSGHETLGLDGVNRVQGLIGNCGGTGDQPTNRPLHDPRTIAGVDSRGRILLATIDGRSTASLGLSIAESAAVAQALGMHDAINLDGGGSTTMVTNNQVINKPSDAAGERPVGDAILILP